MTYFWACWVQKNREYSKEWGNKALQNNKTPLRNGTSCHERNSTPLSEGILHLSLLVLFQWNMGWMTGVNVVISIRKKCKHAVCKSTEALKWELLASWHIVNNQMLNQSCCLWKMQASFYLWMSNMLKQEPAFLITRCKLASFICPAWMCNDHNVAWFYCLYFTLRAHLCKCRFLMASVWIKAPFFPQSLQLCFIQVVCL